MKQSLTYDRGMEMFEHKLLLNTQKCKYILLILIALGREERMKTLTDYFGNIFQRN